MKVGDLVKNKSPGHEKGWLGLVMEAETGEIPGERASPGYWVEYFEDRENWRLYYLDERYDVEVISESK